MLERTRMPARYLDCIKGIAATLVEDAILTGDGLTWESDSPVGSCIYGGNGGIAWFLAHAARFDESGAAATAALRAIRPVLARVHTQVESSDLSWLQGATGIAWAAWGIGERLHRAELRRSAFGLARDIAGLIRLRANRTPLDVTGRLEEVVVGLLAIHRQSPHATILDAARVACDDLLDRGDHEWSGGMALALAETAFASGDKRLLSAAHDVLRHTERFQDPMATGLTRLRIYEETHDTSTLADIDAAVAAARSVMMEAAVELQNGRVSDGSVCHGLASAAELLLVAHSVLGNEDHLRAARRAGDLCLAIYDANDGRWPGGLQKCKASPGLFLGPSGVGSMLVRLYDARVPLVCAMICSWPKKQRNLLRASPHASPATTPTRLLSVVRTSSMN
jgi:lantibiotic modifying enzyme